MMRAVRAFTGQLSSGVPASQGREPQTGGRCPRHMPLRVDRILVQLFPREVPSGCGTGLSCRMGCGGCGSGPSGSVSLRLEDAIRLLREEYEGRVELWVADYSTAESRAVAANELDILLAAAGNELRVSAGNLSEVLAQAGPVIAVNGRITSIIVVPARPVFDRMLDLALSREGPA